MANVDYVGMNIIMKALCKEQGYVLDFSNSSFQKFVQECVNKNIYDSKYSLYGTSKWKRLQGFIKIEDDRTVGNLLLHLLRYRQDVLHEINADEFEKCLKIAYRLSGKNINYSSSKKENSSEPKKINFKKLKDNYFAMLDLKDVQKRGYALEKYLYSLCKEYEMDPRASFKLSHEQIDGSFCMNGVIYLVEAKFKNYVSISEYANFQYKLEERAFPRGLFVTYTSLDDNILDYLKTMRRAIKFIIMTVQEIGDIIEQHLSLQEVIEKKARKLDEEMLPFCSLRELQIVSKVSS